MECRPQNPEFRNNPENLLPCYYATIKQIFTHFIMESQLTLSLQSATFSLC